MSTVTLLVFSVAAVTAVAAVIFRLSDMQASKTETAALTAELNAAILNADATGLLALCDRHLESALGRIVKDVFTKSHQLRASEATMSEVSRMLLDQAMAGEIELADRAPSLLRTIGLICAPLGFMATGWDLALAILSPCGLESSDPAPPYAMMASALGYAIAGILLSLTAFVLCKYLQARSNTELSNLDEACAELFCSFLSRPARK